MEEISNPSDEKEQEKEREKKLYWKNYGKAEKGLELTKGNKIYMYLYVINCYIMIML